MRARIIAEIKRLAAAADGQPPGRKTFKRATGIRGSEWLGVYWARWGDALREAGFEPNAFQGKLDADHVMAKVAQALRHYGHAPTVAELRMYARTDPHFPTHTTVWNFFGTKAEMIRRLRAWLPQHAEYAELVALLPDDAPAPDTSRAARSSALDGYVYLIKSGEFYKIGRSDELERRVKEIRVALPEAATLQHTIRTDDPSGIEAYWHRRFGDRRANGEWFRLSVADVAAFKRRKFQ